MTTQPYEADLSQLVLPDINDSIANIIGIYYEHFQHDLRVYNKRKKMKGYSEELGTLKVMLVDSAKRVLRNSQYGSHYYKEAEQALLEHKEHKTLLQSYEYWKRYLAYDRGSASDQPTYGEVERDAGEDC